MDDYKHWDGWERAEVRRKRYEELKKLAENGEFAMPGEELFQIVMGGWEGLLSIPPADETKLDENGEELRQTVVGDWTRSSATDETKLDDAALASIYAHLYQEETDMEIGRKGDKYEKELYATLRAGDQYLIGRITSDEREELINFAQELYREDPDIHDRVEFGLLLGIGLVLKRSLE